MRQMPGLDTKRTASFNLHAYVIERIELLARLRRTNKSHEAENLIRQALELEPARSELAAATDESEVA